MISSEKLIRYAALFAVALVIAIAIVALIPGPEPVLAVPQNHPKRKVPIVGTPPEGYQQLLPRGGIPAINDPTYVSVDEAEIADDSMVLGVVIEETPIAFSLNLLNSHEIVNDSVGKTNFAAVW